MIPKEKAIELVESFYLCMPFKDVKLTSCDENSKLIVKMEKLSAKQCALIAVDEIITVCHYNSKENLSNWELVGLDDFEFSCYWQEVKQEIENFAQELKLKDIQL